jgi:site-specific DNA-methyltransferase (adenine-specific)
MKEDGLKQSWEGEKVFCNPPYKRGEINKWIEKGYNEGKKENTLVVMLLPVRTDTKYFNDYIMEADEIYFVKGRIKFENAENKNNSAPFPSMIVVFDGFKKEKGFLAVGTIERKN